MSSDCPAHTLPSSHYAAQGFSGKHEYIAAQGPKDNTVRDFWGMVHDYNVRTVVMLTKLVEDGKVSAMRRPMRDVARWRRSTLIRVRFPSPLPQNKCHQYYPELGDRYTWGDLSVACCVQNDLLAYTLRTIVMTKVCAPATSSNTGRAAHTSVGLSTHRLD